VKAWPRQPRLVVGNWKMNRTPAEGAVLARALRSLDLSETGTRVALCPPFPALSAVREALGDSRVLLGAQDLHPEASGAFTGDVSGAMLAAVGCSLVIVGHSERRHGLGEDDALIARKLRAAQREGLVPILCVGETLAERESGRTFEVVERQISVAYGGLSAEAASASIVAYEPVWAIGSGRVATPAQAAEVHQRLRGALDATIERGCGAKIAILYGGSVNAGNAAALFEMPEIDGALVGGASLDASAFAAIIAAA
jgi:triosephosphate isomerase